MPYATALRHPMVAATLKALERVKALPKHLRLAAIVAEVKALRPQFGKHADYIDYGIRSHLKLVDERSCSSRKTTGCQCQELPCHAGPHRCPCGESWGSNTRRSQHSRAMARKYNATRPPRKKHT